MSKGLVKAQVCFWSIFRLSSYGQRYTTIHGPGHYDGLPFTDEAEKTNVDKVMELLEAYFIGETNETYL